MENTQITIGFNTYTIVKGNILQDKDGFKVKLPYFNENVVIDIPSENNNCINWNESYNYGNYISITINGQTLTLNKMKSFIKSLQNTENFNKFGLKLQFAPEYYEVLEFYETVTSIIEQIMKDKINKHHFRNFELTLEL